MDPAQNDRQPRAGAPSPEGKRPVPEDPSVHPDALPSNVRQFPAAAAVAPGEDSEEHLPPVWLARTMLVVFVAFCIEVGLILVAVPWIPHLWHENSLLLAYPGARSFLANDFVRGAVTGVGLLDLWLGVYEAVHYRDPKPLPHA
jgi:hypothetical protein